MKRKAGIVLIIMLFFGCTQKAVKEEITSLINNPGSGKGSDLMLVLCGWPTTEKLRLNSMDIELTPTSGRKGGAGTVNISAASDAFTCKGTIFFTYSSVYMGGHGSGGTEITIGPMKRENQVDMAISDPPGSRHISIGEILTGTLGHGSMQMLDGSFADYYYIDLTDANPIISITLKGEKGLNPQGCIYQNNMLIYNFIDNWPTEMRLKQGKAVFLVTAFQKKGKYSLSIRKAK